MALADVLRERVSRRGRTARVDCGGLGTVTVEALSPRECAALGMSDGGRALLYAACRELQATGEVLRRERRLFTPDEVTAYVSDGEARTAARTVLALSGVKLNEDEADNGDETADKADNEAAESESPDKSDETERPDRTDEKTAENRLESVHESVQQISEVRPEIVQERTAASAESQAESGKRLEIVHTQAPTQDTNTMYIHNTHTQQPEIRPGNVQFQEDAPADGQVSREFSSVTETVREIPSMGPDSDFEPQNLALSEKNGGFMSPLELSGETEDFSAEHPTAHEIKSEIQPGVEMSLHEIKSEFGGGPPAGLHEIKSEFAANGRQSLHEITSEFREPLHETESNFWEAPHEIKSEIGENRRVVLHETTSELAEQVAERLLKGLRRAAMVR